MSLITLLYIWLTAEGLSLIFPIKVKYHTNCICIYILYMCIFLNFFLREAFTGQHWC